MSTNGNGAAARRVEFLILDGTGTGTGQPIKHVCGHRVEYAVGTGVSMAGLMTAVMFVRKASAFNCSWCGGDGTGTEAPPSDETFFSPSDHLLPEMRVTRVSE